MARVVGNDGYGAFEAHGQVFTYATDYNPREDSHVDTEDTLSWDRHSFIGDYLILNFGDYNDLPERIKDIIQTNYLVPGVLTKKDQLLWGKGPHLYSERFQNGELVREWQNDAEIERWLKNTNYLDYFKKVIHDYNRINGTFTKFKRARGGRIGTNFISRVEHISPHKARYAKLKSSDAADPTHIVETDFKFGNIRSVKNAVAYRVFEPDNPFKHRHSIYYSNKYSFCQDYYTVPDIYGSLEWIRRSTTVPKIIKYLQENSMYPRFHVQSPQSFWDKKEQELQEECKKLNKTYKPKMLKQYQDDFMREIAKVMSGVENVGKFWHSTKRIEINGTNIVEEGWDIKPIDMNIKEFISAQIEVSNRSDRAVSSGVGLHGALGNVNESARSNSGSEQIYALKNYLSTGIDMPEMIVTAPMNMAIQANFPGKNLKIGFYHDQAKAEQEETPSQRALNQN